jgi:hypothetical protein
MKFRLDPHADEPKSRPKFSFDAFNSFQLEAQASFRQTSVERVLTADFNKIAQGAAECPGKRAAVPSCGVAEDWAEKVIEPGPDARVNQLVRELAILRLSELNGNGSGR